MVSPLLNPERSIRSVLSVVAADSTFTEAFFALQICVSEAPRWRSLRFRCLDQHFHCQTYVLLLDITYWKPHAIDAWQRVLLAVMDDFVNIQLVDVRARMCLGERGLRRGKKWGTGAETFRRSGEEGPMHFRCSGCYVPYVRSTTTIQYSIPRIVQTGRKTVLRRVCIMSAPGEILQG